MLKPSLEIYFLEGGLALKMGRMEEVTGNSSKCFLYYLVSFSIYSPFKLYFQVGQCRERKRNCILMIHYGGLEENMIWQWFARY